MPATALAPGDLVIHPANARALATVVQVVGDSVAVADDLGTVATGAGGRFWPSAALVALTAKPGPGRRRVLTLTRGRATTVV